MTVHPPRLPLLASLLIVALMNAQARIVCGQSSRPTSRPTSMPADADGPFESEIRAFEAADRQHMPAAGATLFIGSSSIRFWQALDKDFPDFPTVNRGFGGSGMADAVRFVDRIVTPYHPSRIVIYEGDNDMPSGRSPEEIAAQFGQFVDKVQAALPKTPIYFISIKPSPSRAKLMDKMRATNGLIAERIKADSSLHYIDVVTPMLDANGAPRAELFRQDQLHMNAAGYALWTRIVGQALQ